jgi:hypothetical protein
VRLDAESADASGLSVTCKLDRVLNTWIKVGPMMDMDVDRALQ